MSDALNISAEEVEMIEVFGGLLQHWNKMAQAGTLRKHHLMGMDDAKAVVQSSFSLDDIENYKNMAQPAVKSLFEEHDGVIFGLELWQAAEVLTGIQRRVDLCRDWINKDGDISFAAYVRLVIGDSSAPQGSVLRIPLDEAITKYGDPAAFNTTEHELRSFKKASKEYAMSPRISVDKFADALLGHMLARGSAQQEARERPTVRVSGGKFEN